MIHSCVIKMLVVVTGIPGAGKTTVVNAALEKLGKLNVKYEMINYGDVMLEIAKSKKLVKERDEMRKLAPDKQKEIQKKAAQQIAKMAAGRNIILDTHCTIRTPKGYLPGLPEWVIRKLMPDRFVLVEANEDEIHARRTGDASRTRDAESAEEIALHQEVNRNIAEAYSVLTGMTVKVIYNRQNKLDDAANAMVEVLR